MVMRMGMGMVAAGTRWGWGWELRGRSGWYKNAALCQLHSINTGIGAVTVRESADIQHCTVPAILLRNWSLSRSLCSELMSDVLTERTVYLCPFSYNSILLLIVAQESLDSLFTSRHDYESKLYAQPVKWTSTSTTCVLTVGRNIHPVVETMRSYLHDREQCWRWPSRSPCTRIRRLWALHSWCSIGHCHGHM